MKLTGLFKWNREPDQEEGSGAPNHLFDAAPADLALEKRWLRLAQVDSEEFRLFFDKYHDHVYRYLAACVGDPEVAQDLTQETFLYALDHLGRFNLQRGSFGVWLFHIARRRVLTRHRRRGRQAAEAEFLRAACAAGVLDRGHGAVDGRQATDGPVAAEARPPPAGGGAAAGAGADPRREADGRRHRGRGTGTGRRAAAGGDRTGCARPGWPRRGRGISPGSSA